jgi:endonuclease YncB( thermonuclease family)
MSEVAIEIHGRASVIDGDTIDVHGRRIRLWGIDAPESAQTCKDSAGLSYRCGKEAAFALAEHLGSQPVSCSRKDVDQYGRIVAVCRLGRQDVNGWLVERGYALAYPSNQTYLGREAVAKAGRVGIHAGTFVTPWEWRKGVR